MKPAILHGMENKKFKTTYLNNEVKTYFPSDLSSIPDVCKQR